LRRRSFVSSVCLQCVLFFQSIKEVNGHTSGPTRDIAVAKYNRAAEVKELLIKAEALLKRLDSAAALNLFEQAALIVHSSEVEVGIVRAHMQAGQFQRAISFCAHASGAHLEEAAPTLLYAHLLRLSGQTTHAEKLINDHRVKFGESSLKSAKVRLFPYFDDLILPPQSTMLGSGLRLPNNQGVAIPLSMVRGVKNFWVRFGNGFISKATLEPIHNRDGLAVLRVDQLLKASSSFEPLEIASKPVFPGSVAFVMKFERQLPLNWPSLRPSFIGEPAASKSSDVSVGKQYGRRFVDVPSNTTASAGATLGATVFDQTGAAIGLLVPFKDGSKVLKSQLIPFTELGLIAPLVSGTRIRLKLAAEQVYQLGLNNMVQIIGAR
jgi:hypothetical protein